jgi:hypothetical protein
MNDEMANRLFPTSAAQELPTAPAPAPHDPQSRADRIYSAPPAPEPRDDIPPDVATLRDADGTRKLFSPAKAFAADLPDGSLPGIDVVEAREVAADLGAEPADLRELRTLVHEVEPEEGWRVQAEAVMAERGVSAADLAAARQLVQRDPRLCAWLDLSGMGDHPKVVLRFVELGRRARAAGTLPRPAPKR